MWNQLWTQIVAALERLLDALLSVVPALLVLLVAVLLGALAGLLLRGMVRVLLRLSGPGTGRGASLLRAAGLRADPRTLAGTVSFWGAVAVGLAVGVNALSPGALKQVLEEVIGFLPKLLAAALLVLLGAAVGAVARRAVLLASVNASLPWAAAAARAVQVIVVSFFAATALENLGVGQSILVAAFSIVGGGIALTLALAFGLGSRELARQWIEKRLRESYEDTGIRHV